MKLHSKWHFRILPSRFRLRSPSLRTNDRGLTLIELLVASILTAVIILVGWSGLISAMNMSNVAQARSARQTELNRALDFMTNEVRVARSINQSGSLLANGTTVTLQNVVSNAGVNLPALGSYGTLGLYLERSTTPAPAICPAGGPNAGAPPPQPADFDPIVYDIRSSPSGWLKPKMLARYGRVPDSDGTVNPCSSPVSSDPLIDALSTTAKSTPTCPGGLLSGDGGFYTCVVGNQVKFFIQSDVSNVEAKQTSSTAASRILSLPPGLTLSLNRVTGSNTVNLSWAWPSGGTAWLYEVRRARGGLVWTPYIGTKMAFNDSLWLVAPGEEVCFWVKATQSLTKTAESNKVCVIK
ncbi:MAG TPA: prepilin-type N-terminal cleavage/methylation domain-containing protein [Stenomitos sp.]